MGVGVIVGVGAPRERQGGRGRCRGNILPAKEGAACFLPPFFMALAFGMPQLSSSSLSLATAALMGSKSSSLPAAANGSKAFFPAFFLSFFSFFFFTPSASVAGLSYIIMKYGDVNYLNYI